MYSHRSIDQKKSSSLQLVDDRTCMYCMQVENHIHLISSCMTRRSSPSTTLNQSFDKMCWSSFSCRRFFNLLSAVVVMFVVSSEVVAKNYYVQTVTSNKEVVLKKFITSQLQSLVWSFGRSVVDQKPSLEFSSFFILLPTLSIFISCNSYVCQSIHLTYVVVTQPTNQPTESKFIIIIILKAKTQPTTITR